MAKKKKSFSSSKRPTTPPRPESKASPSLAMKSDESNLNQGGIGVDAGSSQSYSHDETDQLLPSVSLEREKERDEMQTNRDGEEDRGNRKFLRQRSSVNNLRESEETNFPKRDRSGSANIRPLTLWDYLLLELGDNGLALSGQDKAEHLSNVIKIPLYLERVIFFGMLTCLDSFLYIFTILPLRIIYSFYRIIIFRASNARKSDALKGVILIVVLHSMLQLDTSRIYHNIRGQAAIKLYVMINVLEVADKLCSALGQDMIECLFSAGTLSSSWRLPVFAILVGGYFYAHCLIMLYQTITLNVAVNSYSNALLTLLLSNQFSEIKGAVFKKFEREELFQLTCADITERFQLMVILLVIGVRNAVEVSNVGLIPASWAGWNRWLGALFGPAVVVVGSEVIVDSMKHAYVTKFNSLKPKIYRKFLDVLAMDYADNALSDQIVSRRTGLPVYPLAIVSAKMLLQSYNMWIEQSTSVSVGNTSQSPTATIRLNLAKTAPPSVLNKIDIFLAKMGFWPALSSPSPTPTPSQLIETNNSSTVASFFDHFEIPFEALSILNTLVICSIIYIVLLFVKLVLGVLLLRYSTKRCAVVRRYRQNRSHKARDDYSDVKPTGVLDEKIRSGLYEPEEDVPNAKKPKYSSTSDGYGDLIGVSRFKMSSKRIW
ncbi:Emp65p [Sugiyamaella lignohabitans]|uniref:Emp65p n=1 Tax=Sugiyamaella lignohabitans TaxID=796027 RepID=A0A167EGX7_9ASCO|nr:Emp65p [Sugiyamaella lignohabitans]ANB14069.1 Emp65p [Sugiyamaella lignohabitans]